MGACYWGLIHFLVTDPRSSLNLDGSVLLLSVTMVVIVFRNAEFGAAGHFRKGDQYDVVLYTDNSSNSVRHRDKRNILCMPISSKNDIDHSGIAYISLLSRGC